MRCRIEIGKQEGEKREREAVQVVRVARPQKEKQWKEPACSIRKNAQENKMRCFEYEGVGHQCKDCPNRRLEKEKVACCYTTSKFSTKDNI